MITKKELLDYLSDYIRGSITIDELVEFVNNPIEMTQEELLEELGEITPTEEGPLHSVFQHITMGKVCPVCQGRGMVPAGFYNVGGIGVFNSDCRTLGDLCKSCNGRGII